MINKNSWRRWIYEKKIIIFLSTIIISIISTITGMLANQANEKEDDYTICEYTESKFIELFRMK